jgi:hypothetical protein
MCVTKIHGRLCGVLRMQRAKEIERLSFWGISPHRGTALESSASANFSLAGVFISSLRPHSIKINHRGLLFFRPRW